ncbi:hypothetical protein [Leisingera aquaemixtae]|nr:hypothetical protein [Leisingera aquaemixtae]
MAGSVKLRRGTVAGHQGRLWADQVPNGEDGSQLCSGSFLR